jgi:ATP citrate (pro-S)-lyase
MSRKRLSEFRAKSILYASLGLPYDGVEVDREKEDWPTNLPAKAGPYVVKVDQAVKGRFKKGLVRLNRSSKQLADDVREISAKGYRFLLIEPYRTHTPEDERYLSLQLTRDGIVLTSSVRGGVEVESHTDSLQSALYAPGMSLDTLGIPADALTHIVESFTENYFSFLEINPLVVTESEILLLDAAVEVDEEGEFFENNWTETDFRRLTSRKLAPQENAVIELAAQSQASFTLEVINPMARVKGICLRITANTVATQMPRKLRLTRIKYLNCCWCLRPLVRH